jgi:gas vesicle protein
MICLEALTEVTDMSEELAAKSGSKPFYFLVGLGLGSLIGILFAPKSGDETRGYLSDKLKEGSEYTHKKTRDLRGRTGARVEHGKNMVTQKKEQITAAVDVGREVYKQEIANARAAGTETE